MNTLVIEKPIEFIKLKLLESKLSHTISLVSGLLDGKRRHTGEDSFMHSYRMFKKCIESGIYDEIILNSMLLHDIIEDSEFTVLELRNKFGFHVSFIVEALTSLDNNKLKIDKELYFENFANNSGVEWRILFVKLFDSIDNLETICGLTPEKQIAFVKEKKEIFLPIFERNVQNIPFDFRAIYKEKINEFKDLLILNEYEK